MIQEVNYEVIRGDTWVTPITIVDGLDVAIDITGWTIYLTVKKNKYDTDVNAIYQLETISHTDPVNGNTMVSIDGSGWDNFECGTYYYDIQVKESTGQITTLVIGRFKVVEDVTDKH